MKRIFFILSLSMTSCVTSNNSDSTFKKYLTKEEKLLLAGRGEIKKIHTSIRRNGNIHWTGSLRVRLDDGKYSFSSSGTWKGYYKTGELFSIASFNSEGQLIHEQIFELNGIKSAEVIGYAENRGSEIVKLEKLINYIPPLYQDTISVETFIVKGKKLIRDGIQKYYDEQGQVMKTIQFRNGKEVNKY